MGSHSCSSFQNITNAWLSKPKPQGFWGGGSGDYHQNISPHSGYTDPSRGRGTHPQTQLLSKSNQSPAWLEQWSGPRTVCALPVSAFRRGNGSFQGCVIFHNADAILFLQFDIILLIVALPLLEIMNGIPPSSALVSLGRLYVADIQNETQW